MIADCPGCGARYRIEPSRLRSEGVRLRCSRCEAIFRVRPPAAQPESKGRESAETVVPPSSQASLAADSKRSPAHATASPLSAPPDPAEPPTDRDRLVLIADPEIEQGKATAGALVHWGLQPILVHDGVEAIMTIQRMIPRAIVIDAALPKMFGFQVCELVKRNESLRHIKVALVGAIHDPERYRRPPSELYGADSYLERPQLPAGLKAILSSFGLPVGSDNPPVAPAGPKLPMTPDEDSEPGSVGLAPFPQSSSSSPHEMPGMAGRGSEGSTSISMAPRPFPVETVVEPPAAAPDPAAIPSPSPAPISTQDAPSEVTPAGDAEPSEEVARAERLARIVVSDIVLYNQKKFDAAVRAGNVLEAMDAEMAEGRALVAARIDASLRQQRDFLAEELLRVASSRSGA
jgi:predicted Zn finger-like uncharacterized protein